MVVPLPRSSSSATDVQPTVGNMVVPPSIDFQVAPPLFGSPISDVAPACPAHIGEPIPAPLDAEVFEEAAFEALKRKHTAKKKPAAFMAKPAAAIADGAAESDGDEDGMEVGASDSSEGDAPPAAKKALVMPAKPLAKKPAGKALVIPAKPLAKKPAGVGHLSCYYRVPPLSKHGAKSTTQHRYTSSAYHNSVKAAKVAGRTEADAKECGRACYNKAKANWTKATGGLKVGWDKAA